jgi:hypothetical protein
LWNKVTSSVARGSVPISAQTYTWLRAARGVRNVGCDARVYFGSGAGHTKPCSFVESRISRSFIMRRPARDGVKLPSKLLNELGIDGGSDFALCTFLGLG